MHPKTKVQTRSDKCCFLGYEGTTQFRLFDPTTNKVLSRQRNVDFIEDDFLDRTAFLKVPYAERPLQVPEPRNYTEFDEELDEDEISDLFPEIKSDPQTPDPAIPMLSYMPAARAPDPVDNARVSPRWQIPSPTRSSPELPKSSSSDSDSDSGMEDSASMPPLHRSPHGSPRPTSPLPPVPPVQPVVRQSTRQKRPTWRKIEGQESRSLNTHTGPSLQSASLALLPPLITMHPSLHRRNLAHYGKP